jgi:hypothetical protein
MKMPDQGHVLIAEHKGRIKLQVISNAVIILDHQFSLTQRLTIVVHPPIIAQLQIAEFGRWTKPHASYGSTIHIDRCIKLSGRTK